MSTELWIDGVDAASTYGFRLTSSDGLRDLPSRKLDTLAIPFVAGLTVLAEPQIDARTVSLPGVLVGSSIADVRAKRAALFAVLRRGRVMIRLADAPTLQLPIDITGVKIPAASTQMLARTLPIQIDGLALDPYWVDVTPQSVIITASPVATPLGTAPVAPVITFTPTGSVVTITLRTTLGTIVTALQLAGLEVGVACTIDCAAKTMRQGAISVLSTLISGDFPVLDAVTHGDYAASAWPTLAISQGTATVTYARRWA